MNFTALAYIAILGAHSSLLVECSVTNPAQSNVKIASAPVVSKDSTASVTTPPGSTKPSTESSGTVFLAPASGIGNPVTVSQAPDSTKPFIVSPFQDPETPPPAWEANNDDKLGGLETFKLRLKRYIDSIKDLVQAPVVKLPYAFKLPPKVAFPGPQVTSESTDLCKEFTDAKVFTSKLYSFENKETIIRAVFCENALSYLPNLTFNAILTARKPADLFLALIVRQKSLSSLYSDVSIKEGYLQCIDFMASKVSRQPPTENWPCTAAKNCVPADVSNQIIATFERNYGCRSILKGEIMVLAALVAKAVEDNADLQNSPTEVRHVIGNVLIRSDLESIEFGSLMNIFSKSYSATLQAWRHLCSLKEAVRNVKRALATNPKIFEGIKEAYNENYMNNIHAPIENRIKSLTKSIEQLKTTIPKKAVQVPVAEAIPATVVKDVVAREKQ